jgi:hypothetical protein
MGFIRGALLDRETVASWENWLAPMRTSRTPGKGFAAPPGG